MAFFNGEECIPMLKPKAQGTSLVGCPWLLVQNACCCHLYLNAVFFSRNLRMHNAVVAWTEFFWRNTVVKTVTNIRQL
jgi:hypothetical protein